MFKPINSFTIAISLSLFTSFLFTGSTIAETKIHEVQPYPIDGPTQLVI